MTQKTKNITILVILFVVASLFYVSAWFGDMSISRKFFICGIVGAIHGGISSAIIAAWEK